MSTVLERWNESSKYAEGRLHILFFDAAGAKRELICPDTQQLVEARLLAEARIASDPSLASFVILRIIHNSHTGARWEPQREPTDD